jgi:electron transfer flavoprotein beta subunit
VKNAAALGIATDVKAKVAKVVPPPARAAGKIICGDDAAQKAAELARCLREEAKVI